MKLLCHLFNPGPFMPHGNCYLWSTGLVAANAVTDALIVLAYFSISVTLLVFIVKRKDLTFRWIFLCFALFILSCGATHLLEIWNIWHANYWVSSSLKAVTAIASVSTAILLIKVLPEALALPGPSALQTDYDALEQRVQERTEELEQTTKSLEAEIANRKVSELEAVRLAAIV